MKRTVFVCVCVANGNGGPFLVSSSVWDTELGAIERGASIIHKHYPRKGLTEADYKAILANEGRFRSGHVSIEVEQASFHDS